MFHFYEGRERRRSVSVDNKMQEDFKKIRAEVEKLPAWSMSDFDRAKAWVYRDFSNPTKLFNALEADKNFYLFN